MSSQNPPPVGGMRYPREIRLRPHALKATAPVLILLTALFAGLGYLWVKSRPVTYQVDSTVILLVDQKTSENPYAYFPRSVIVTAQAVVRRLDQPSVRDDIRRRGGVDDYQISVTNYGNQWVPIYTEPTIQLTGRSTDATALARTSALAVERMWEELQGLQRSAGAPADDMISLQTLVMGFPTPLHGRLSRALAAVVLLALWGAVLVVGFVRRRSVRWRPARWETGPVETSMVAPAR